MGSINSWLGAVLVATAILAGRRVGDDEGSSATPSLYHLRVICS